MLQATSRLDEAEPLMRRALARGEKSYGSEHPHVATNLSHLAALLYNTSRLGEAEPLLRRALTIDEKSFGPDHPYVATNLNNPAALLHATNRLDEGAAAAASRTDHRREELRPRTPQGRYQASTTWHSCYRPQTVWAEAESRCCVAR